MNKVLLCGNIVEDGELRFTDSGKARVKFTLAINKRISKDHTKTTFIPCVIWGKLGESTVTYLKKGTQLIIDGELGIDSIKSEEGWKTYACVNVNELQFGRTPKDRKQECERNNKNRDMTEVDEDVPF